MISASRTKNIRQVALTVHEFKRQGVIMGMHSTEKSIQSFARACINSLAYSLAERCDLWFGAKDTISKTYHKFFREFSIPSSCPSCRLGPQIP